MSLPQTVIDAITALSAGQTSLNQAVQAIADKSRKENTKPATVTAKPITHLIYEQSRMITSRYGSRMRDNELVSDLEIVSTK
jgi:hypothetical protein